MKITTNQLRRIIREEIAAASGRVYVVSVSEFDGEIVKRVYTLNPNDRNRALRPDQFCADTAARMGELLLDVIVTDVPADLYDEAGRVEAKYGNEWAPGDEPNPRLSMVSPVSGGWNPAGAPKLSDSGWYGPAQEPWKGPR